MAEKFDPRNADKLENPERLVELPPANLIRLLELTGAETVVDYGAGTGMYSLPVADALPARAAGRGRRAPGAARAARATRSRAHPPAGDACSAVQTTDNAVPAADGAADRVFMVNVLHHVHDEPAALAEVVRLLGPGGRLVAVDFARMDRPVGPPNDHVLALDDARAVLAGMGLRELAVHRPGEVGRYHIAIVAEKAAACAWDVVARGRPSRRARPSLVSHVRAAHGDPLAAARSTASSRRSAAGRRIVAPGETRRRQDQPAARRAAREGRHARTPRRSRHVLRALKAAGARPFVADSPGGLNGPAKVARAYRISGISPMCARGGRADRRRRGRARAARRRRGAALPRRSASAGPSWTPTPSSRSACSRPTSSCASRAA